MAEGVTFWLDNKKSVGTKAASIGDQLLVNYRNRFYLVADGVAVMKGSKALRYSHSTLPVDWKMILREETASTGACAAGSPSADLDKPAKSPVTRKLPVKKMIETDGPVMSGPTLVELPRVVPEVKQKPSRKEPKPASNTATVTTASVQTTVPVECPYCSHNQDISIEKGISGKPFFQNCTMCRSDFAVRLVAMTTYQAQVAGFLSPPHP